MKQVSVGNCPIGDGNITIQSMCNIPFSELERLIQQALALEQAGCDILRVSVPDKEAVQKFSALKKTLSIPLVADIHFDYRLALGAISAGADKIRINPGNIGKEHIKTVAAAARDAGIPIRVGVNSGSLEKDLLAKYGGPTAKALSESAFLNVDLLRDCGFEDIVVSMKSSDVKTMVESYRIFSQNEAYPFPLHLGVTEAGTVFSGLIKSSAGIGSLLLDGIGDTIRISLTADPVEEVKAAKILLRALGLRREGLEVVSCPTCGRTTTDTIELANRIEKEFGDITEPVKIAVMGCVVNGPGEARQADFGVTGANGEYIIFKDGAVQKRVPESKIMEVIREEIEKYMQKNN